jgi:nucleoporin-like protein 2
MEFTNLLNSARPSQTPSFPTMSSFPEVKNNSSFGASQTNGPPVFSSFSQIGAATNIGPGPGTTAPGMPASSPFGHPSSAPLAAPTFGSSQMKFGVSSMLLKVSFTRYLYCYMEERWHISFHLVKL